jgi:hypothetical protein
LIAGRIDDPDHSLASRMYVDVPDFDCLLIAPSITVKGSDHLIMKPKKLDSVVAVNIDEFLGHVLLVLSKKLQPGKTRGDDLHCKIHSNLP